MQHNNIKKMLKYNKITISLQKDYNYNQIDGYFGLPISSSASVI